MQASATAQSWYAKGTDALRSGAAYQASRLLARALEADPRFVPARARLAEAYFDLDNRIGAQQELLKVPRGLREVLVLEARAGLDHADAVALLGQAQCGDRATEPRPDNEYVEVEVGHARPSFRMSFSLSTRTLAHCCSFINGASQPRGKEPASGDVGPARVCGSGWPHVLRRRHD